MSLLKKKKKKEYSGSIDLTLCYSMIEFFDQFPLLKSDVYSKVPIDVEDSFIPESMYKVLQTMRKSVWVS